MYTDYSTDTYGTDFYGTDTYGTDTYGTAGVAENAWAATDTASCCCDSGAAASYEVAWELPPEPPAPAYEPVVEPSYDASAVMPAGQPGGPEPVATTTPYATSPVQAVPMAPGPAPLGSAISSTDFVPMESATIGGNPGAVISSTDFVPMESATIGGNPWEISSADFAPAETGSIIGSSTTIGPIDPHSTMGNLLSVYDVAARNDDLWSQIQLSNIMGSMNRSSLIWTI
jgi:hypothetical protein